ncbi:MAG: hypothetical protein SCG72_00015 [Nitrosarchaeum sp.]|nr:hypothetical protein [Nitrosarchaeum sp.]
MRTLSQFLVSCEISHPSFAGNLVEYTYGDSIAVGYGGKNPGSRRVGASPAEVLSYLERDLKDNPDKFKGKTVNISTGVSNNPGDFSSIESQLKRLKASGANVNVYGAAQGRYDKENERLGSLSSTYGANFKGGFKAGRDGVHPASYDSYDSTPSTPRTPAKLETPKTLAPVSSVLSKLKGVEGTGAGSNFVAKKWTDSEGSRYKSYGGK